MHKKIALPLLGLALLLTLGACSSGNKSNAASSSKAKTETVAKSSSTDSSSTTSSSSSSESSSTSSSSSSAQSSSSSSSSSATQIASSDAAINALKPTAAAKFANDAPLVYAFDQQVTVNGKTGYQIEVGKNNGRSTIALYNVFTDGTIQLVKVY